MKNYFYPILILSVCLLLSCSKNKDTTVPKELRVEINTPTVYDDGLDELVVTVFDADNINVTANSQILIDNNPIIGNIFKSNGAKTYTVKALLNSKESNTVTFKAIRHDVSKFSKKITIEEFSGMWCSFCTRFTYLIDTMVRNNNKIIPVSVHSGDILQYVFVNQMRQRFQTSDFPSAYVSRFKIWDESSALLQSELNRKSKCGLAISTSINNDVINATVKVKFDITTSESLNIVVLLLEDSLIYPQSNYYDSQPTSPFFNLGDPIQNYRHNNTMRVAVTDIFGDVIPVTVQRKNETWEKNYTINASGYNIANCKVVAFVQYTQNTVTRWGVLNAQVIRAGNNTDFD
jgi:hypothetical protein